MNTISKYFCGMEIIQNDVGCITKMLEKETQKNLLFIVKHLESCFYFNSSLLKCLSNFDGYQHYHSCKEQTNANKFFSQIETTFQLDNIETIQKAISNVGGLQSEKVIMKF